MATGVSGVEIHGPLDGRLSEVLTAEALAFVGDLHRRFNPTRLELLERRRRRYTSGEMPDFLPETREIREGDWQVAPAPDDLQDRRVEITGPTDRKMVINALNSGARGFMADFEDSNSPTWRNMIGGHVNLRDAIERTIEYESPDGRNYRLEDETATLLVRPRGWHLGERHVRIDGEPIAGALIDFGLHVFHNARRLLDSGSGPYFYLPKLESHREARLWNDVFVHAQEALSIPHGAIKATVLIETIPAAFEMDEILYELRDHSAGLNAGRWDYIFSMIKCFRERPEFILPDRAKVTMTVPFMHAYTELLVKTCHRRGAHAMGGMAAFIPSRKRPEINDEAIAGVRGDKEREAGDGFDGTWVAHPDLVAVATEEFDKVLGERPNQVARQRDDVDVGAAELLDAASAGAEVTEQGLRNNVNVGIQYISSWLCGNGAAAIFNLMEDAATAEIARAQVWQWIRHGAKTDGGDTITADLVRWLEEDELERIREQVGDDFFYDEGRPEQSRALFDRVAVGPDWYDFLTLVAYEELEGSVGLTRRRPV